MSSAFQVPALIPAAGRGTRLRPISSYFSKPMLPLGNQPVIRWVIREARRANCSPLVVIVNPADQKLIEYIKKDCRQDVFLVEQPRPRGLADALLVGYDHLSTQKPVAILLADNIILNSGGMDFILKNRRDEWLTFGTVKVKKDEAQYFGNSGGYENREIEGISGEIEKIISLQKKGEGNFKQAGQSWPARRTVGRALLPPGFFEITRRMEPDPSTGELDDVPVYRKLLNQRAATGILLPQKVYDMGQPERYLRLCAACFRKRNDEDVTDESLL